MKILTRFNVFVGLLVATLLMGLQQPVSAHSSSSLRDQINACSSYTAYSSATQDFKVITCGYGQAEYGGIGLIAKDTATDTHCQYSKKFNSSTGRYVELKSCGGWEKTSLSSSTLSLGNCITGHWYCYWPSN